ncbi:uncharacterized protein LOC105836407 [Monomorium pharaonis]|uniref:uncharacterized protein LOC105836407 n=1 Tax=Monomorium pharaonis TaxID=307658 RepID=UPI00063F53DB|nr:uncharacterized protein LOC105836407 [Monomorium pharaonis]
MSKCVRFNMNKKDSEQTKDAKLTEKIHTTAIAIEPNDQYGASYLKTGIMHGIMFEMKILTWVTWKLMCQSDPKIGRWWLATEVSKARGFHDLVLKYIPHNTEADGSTSETKYMYRFVQIRHKRSLQKHAHITSYYLTSTNKFHRQGSLIYLFKSYVNMLGNFENITSDQIADLTIFTNMDINAFSFLVPVNNDKLYGFEGKGKRYHIDIKILQKEPGIIIQLYNIKNDEKIIFDFLKKLVFMVCQPSEHEMEKLIVEEMRKTFNVPQIFYDNLYKNIIDWFLIYDDGKAPYLTENDVTKYLKETEATLEKAKETKTYVGSSSVSKLSKKLRLLSL